MRSGLYGAAGTLDLGVDIGPISLLPLANTNDQHRYPVRESEPAGAPARLRPAPSTAAHHPQSGRWVPAALAVAPRYARPARGKAPRAGRAKRGARSPPRPPVLPPTRSALTLAVTG